jgi:hypothetical protein
MCLSGEVGGVSRPHGTLAVEGKRIHATPIPGRWRGRRFWLNSMALALGTACHSTGQLAQQTMSGLAMLGTGKAHPW